MIPRLVIMLPIKIVGGIAEITAGVCEALFEAFDEHLLPIPYKVTMVEFDKLSKREQKSVEQLQNLKERMMFQTQKVCK
jgi:hypothetical protein